MITLSEYELPRYIEDIFDENCYFLHRVDINYFRYIFDTFDKNGQLPEDLYEQKKLAVALLKFHNSLTSRLEDEYYQPYNIDFNPNDFPLEITKDFYYDDFTDKPVEFSRYDEVSTNYFILNEDYDEERAEEEDDYDEVEEFEIVYGEDLDELGYVFNYVDFIEFCYDDSDLIPKLCENFTPTQMFILFMVFAYNLDDEDYLNTTSEPLTNIANYSDYLTAISDKFIRRELTSSEFYKDEYYHVFAEIRDIM